MLKDFFALARGVFSQDMDLTKFKSRSTASRRSKIAFPIFIFAMIMLAVGYYASNIIAPLHELGVAYLLPTIFIVIFAIISLFEGIYKSSSILFDCSDNDLLFSLPIPRRHIFAIRVVKLLTFQTLYNAIFMLPVFAVYAFTVQPDPIFYPISLLMLLLTPLIPTAIAVVLGYIIKALSLKSRFQKSAQIILTFLFLAIIGIVMINSQDILNSFVENATSITDIIGHIYYPAGAFARLIADFHIGDLLGLLAISILPLIAVIYLCSIHYFHIISKVNSHTTAQHRQVTITGRQSSVTAALVKREISRYFSSSVFVFNSLFGLILLLIGVILLSVNFDGLTSALLSSAESGFTSADMLLALPDIYLAALIFMLTMTSITSSSISIEGKTFLITKSLPITPSQLLRSKLLASLVITYPITFLCDLIFIFRFTPSLLTIVAIICTSILVPIFTGLTGLLMNLKYPKMNAASDAEVVKQSASSMFSVFIGLAVGIIAIVIISVFHDFWFAPLILITFFLIADCILWRILTTRGIKKFHQIEI